MQKSTAIMELVAGYDTFATAADLEITAISDAPATTPACVITGAAIGGAGASWLATNVATATYKKGC
ncbi:hypothetical protein [Kitasatospora purpeofusca]|uniref:hypothetical protein n=1 Tax=Kitasatospora purpeofusca TaxID=67352 RepID=UPI00366007F1